MENQSTIISIEDQKEIKKAHMNIRAINHPLRLKLLERIQSKGNRSMVTEVYCDLRLEQSVCSQHLAILRKAGAVTTERSGKFIMYSVNQERINHIIAQAKLLNSESAK